MKVIIVDGVADGASCAARLRRFDDCCFTEDEGRGPHLETQPGNLMGFIQEEQHE